MQAVARWLCVGCCCVALSLGAAVFADEADSIFNGQDLSNWDGNPDFWRVEDGSITGETTKEKPTNGNTFCIWKGGNVDDFELTLKYKIVGGNSGIQYRSFEAGKWVIGGYQADIDSTGGFTGILYGERDRGIIADRGQKVEVGEDGKPKVTSQLGEKGKLLEAVKKDDWNDYKVTALGNHLVHEINGVVMVDITDNDKEVTEPGKKGRRMSGLLALQLHAGPPMKVQFKEIKLKKLKVSAATGAANSDKANEPKAAASDGAKKKILFIAGNRSHGYGAHDHKAGCHLLAKLLNESGLPIEATVHYPGWPTDPKAIEGYNAIVVYADGGGGHPIAKHVDEVMPLAKKGMGLGFIHYGVEVEKGKVGDAFLDWTGGYFETNWSVNPHWTLADTKINTEHQIGRGVGPYAVNDEWYYHMRFRPKMEGVEPILTAMPPKETLSRGDGTHSGNPDVRKAVLERMEPQHLMWATQRADGGRGFGFTGGHVHWNWAQPDHRRLVLNGCVWISGLDVPSAGVVEKNPLAADDLLANHDEDAPANAKQEAEKRLAEYSKK